MAIKREDKPNNRPRRGQGIPDWLLLVTGLTLLLVPIIIAVKAPEVFTATTIYLRIIAALGAAIIGAFIPGALQLNMPGIKAAGALALFALTFSTNPPKLAADALAPAAAVPPAAAPPPHMVFKICMGEGGGSNCLSGADAKFDCDQYGKMGGGGQPTENALADRFCGYTDNGGHKVYPHNIIVYQNNGGGKCGWTGFQVTCN